MNVIITTKWDINEKDKDFYLAALEMIIPWFDSYYKAKLKNNISVVHTSTSMIVDKPTETITTIETIDKGFN